MKKKIAVIGVGGRTGTMLFFELKDTSYLLGIGRNVEKIKKKELFLERKKNDFELFEGSVISEDQWFTVDFLPEIIFLATKNPIGPAIKFYYQKFKEKNLPPATLVLSQNGIGAVKEALSSLKEIFGKDFLKIKVVRVSLFNPIDKKRKESKDVIIYSLPIKISFAKVSGSGDLKDLSTLFQEAKIKATELPPQEAKNMEYSKLFFNLIGIASATKGLSVKEGFQSLEVFQEEVEVLKEYIKVVLANKGKFLNIPNYPAKNLSILVRFFPLNFFLFFRKFLGRMVSKNRKGKPKQLDEIKYYNGAVVDLGKKVGIVTSTNEKILKRVLSNYK